MPPIPYCAEKSESLTLTSAIASKIGVKRTLLLIGELVDAPSSSAVENGRLPFAAAPPMPGFPELLPFCGAPFTPGRRTRNPCQSGAPDCGSSCKVSDGRVVDNSGFVVSSSCADSLTTTPELSTTLPTETLQELPQS